VVTVVSMGRSIFATSDQWSLTNSEVEIPAASVWVAVGVAGAGGSVS